MLEVVQSCPRTNLNQVVFFYGHSSSVTHRIYIYMINAHYLQGIISGKAFESTHRATRLVCNHKQLFKCDTITTSYIIPTCPIYSLPDTYLMALFSPRPLTESGELAASIPGLFLFPCKDTRETERVRGTHILEACFSSFIKASVQVKCSLLRFLE